MGLYDSCEPWDERCIYRSMDGGFFTVNVGKYTSPMEHLGGVFFSRFFFSGGCVFQVPATSVSHHDLTCLVRNMNGEHLLVKKHLQIKAFFLSRLV